MATAPQNIRVARSPWQRGLLVAFLGVVFLAVITAAVAGPIWVATDPEFRADAQAVAATVVVLIIAALLVPLVPACLRALIRKPRIRLVEDRLVIHDPMLFRQDEVVVRNEIQHVQRVDDDWRRTLATFQLSPFRERVTVAVAFIRPRQFSAARTGWYNSIWTWSRVPQEAAPLPEPQSNYSGFSFRAREPDEAIATLRRWLTQA